MHATHSEFEQLAGVLAAADEPLTAREILHALNEQGETAFESTHQIATVLGRWAKQGVVRVQASRPYQYQPTEST